MFARIELASIFLTKLTALATSETPDHGGAHTQNTGMMLDVVTI